MLYSLQCKEMYVEVQDTFFKDLKELNEVSHHIQIIYLLSYVYSTFNVCIILPSSYTCAYIIIYIVYVCMFLLSRQIHKYVDHCNTLCTIYCTCTCACIILPVLF